jgi:hypothetical protein
MTVQLQLKDYQLLTGKALKNNAHGSLKDHPRTLKDISKIQVYSTLLHSSDFSTKCGSQLVSKLFTS